MMETLMTFTVPGEPVGKGRPHFVRKTGRAFTPEKTVMYENFVGICYMEQVGKPPIKAGFPLKLSVTMFHQIPKSASKRKRVQMMSGLIRPTKKPDCSNVLKAVEDGLNRVAYADDSQIVEICVQRYYDDEPRVVIKIEEASL